MMLWAKNSYKSVTFTPEVADQTLLSVIETELAKQPHKTFSDLCKEALWQFLCVPASTRPNLKAGQVEQQLAELLDKLATMESGEKTVSPAPEPIRLEPLEMPLRQVAQQSRQMLENIALLQSQMAEMERRVTAAESSRTQQLEAQIAKLNEKLQQLLERNVNFQQLAPEPAAEPQPEPEPESPPYALPEPDPLLSRLSQFLDDF